MEGFDVVIREEDECFKATGLRVSSVARLNFLASVPVSKMTRRLGEVPAEMLRELRTNLSSHIVATHLPEG
tara:strand:- start:70 stop:282 length:213 start_codon:yes stop_codon:yes gene_type:complete